MNIKRMICLGLAVLMVLSLPVSFVAFADDYLIEDSGIAEDILYEDVYYDDLIEEYVDEYVEDPEEFFDSSEIFEESTEEIFDVNDDN